MQTVAIVPAAGQGKRMSSHRPKQFLPLGGQPVLAHTLAVLDACPLIDGIILVVDSPYLAYCRDELLPQSVRRISGTVIVGGAERQDSVYRGLLALAGREPAIVVVHDGARPLVPQFCLSGAIETARRCGAAVAAVPVQDTLKIADRSGVVIQTPDRSTLWMAQTPQAFAYPLLLAAYERARQDAYQGTDDASLVERIGARVTLVPGSYENIKITTPQDIHLAEAILRDREAR